MEPDRRPVTAFFCDLVDSTQLSTQLDPEDLRDMIRSYQERAAHAIARFGGYISRFMGDGILVFFGYPEAQEDAAERAIRAALEVVKGVKKIDSGADLQVRIGIATGLVVAGDLIGEGSAEERAIVGETPNLAARLQSCAGPNQVCIADSTYRLVRGLFDTGDYEEIELKGFAIPQRAYRVLGTKTETNRFEMTHAGRMSHLVGRSEELGILQNRFTDAERGEGQVVLLSGEAGIGKSRVALELQARLHEQPHNTISIRCSPIHRNTALYPVVQFLQRWLESTARKGETPLTTLERTLKQLGLGSVEAAPLLASLLGIEFPADRFPPLELSPQKMRRRTHELLGDCLLRQAAVKPVIAIWEDLHWSDPSTLDVLTHVIERTEHASLLLLLTFRPEFDPPWDSTPYITTVVLRPLNRSNISQLIDRLTSDTQVPKALIDSLVERSDGVPLFAEELTQMLLETQQATNISTADLEIPFTLHDLLLSRLDRLGPARNIAQVASVLGRQFTNTLLYQVADEPPSQVDQSLQSLVDAYICTCRTVGADTIYQFRHALIQDAAYASMLRKKRAKEHLCVANVLEGSEDEWSHREPEVLAHHLTEAGELERAIAYWQQAGNQSRDRFDNLEAVNHFRTALDLLNNMDKTPERLKQELGLLVSIGLPLTALRGYGSEEVGAIYDRAREITLAGGKDARLFPVLHGLYRFYFVRAELQTANDMAARLKELADIEDDRSLELEARRAMGFTLSMLGETAIARDHLERAAELYDREAHANHVVSYGTDPLVASRSNGAAAVLCGQGEFALAKSWIDEALELAREMANPFNLAWTLCYASVVAQQMGNVAEAQSHAEECINTSKKYDMAFWLAGGTIMSGWCLWRQGEVNNGLSLMREGLNNWSMTGASIYLCYFHSLLLHALIDEGRTEEAADVYKDIAAHIDNTGERWWAPEVERLYGELLCQQTPLKKGPAVAVLERAANFARSQGQRTLELRTLMSLYRILPDDHHQGQLEQCLAGFDPSLDVHDLRDAKLMLRNQDLSRKASNRARISSTSPLE